MIDFDKCRRAYGVIDGKIRHVYIISTFTQVDIFGENTWIAAVALTKKSKELVNIEVSKLSREKPRQIPARKVNQANYA